MSNRGKITALVVSIVCLITLVLYWYIKAYTPKYNWRENFEVTSDQPYGLKLFYDLLKSTHPKNNFVFIKENPKNYFDVQDSNALYVFVGSKIVIDSINSIAITNFVKRGNNVFISSTRSDNDILDILTKGKFRYIDYQEHKDSIVRVCFDSLPENKFVLNHKYGKKLADYNWTGFDSLIVADSLRAYGFQRVSYIAQNSFDCIRVKYGKGWFVFHHNPIYFTNYCLSTEIGINYVNHLFSPYQKSKIYWDDYSRTELKSDNKDHMHQTPLKFILSEKSLRWAWYLLCFFVLVFVIFNSKRKQAYMPLLPENKNMTIEYINSIATLHYESKSADFLADEILKQLLSFVKHKYGISPHLKKNEIAEQLAPLSGISEEKLNELFKYYMGVKYSQSIENKDLIEFYRLTEYFYQNCK